MIKKYVFGEPFNTEAVCTPIPASQGNPEYGSIDTQNGFTYTYKLGEKDKIFGLGENVRGINKRGFEYISDCTDIPRHFEDTKSLYGAHNFLIVSGEQTFGLFLDYPARMTFDLGYQAADKLVISCEKADLDLYVITAADPYAIVKEFRSIIGRSYIPPKFAFGFGQSRWGYKTQEDFLKVAREHRKNHVPLDMIYMDIDYMESYKDFTLNPETFSDFPDFVQKMKDDQVRLIPIIDAGVKVEKDYPVYEEGVARGYFCKRADGSDFVATVWPGETHFPDVLNKEARKWFGDKYRFLLDQGIEGFWNDMNEPSIFNTPESLKELKETLSEFVENPVTPVSTFKLTGAVLGLSNNPKDYANFYHNVDGKKVCHKDVHNLFGYNMTRAAGEAFERLRPDARILMFSRSSYVGMHRYGGIWMGDNLSWWSHLLMNLKMLPSLNMMGILYTGADLGGFGSDTSRDLLLRWLALGVFTPLMRNHAAQGTREQEFYQFENAADFAHVIGVRYRLIPYLYSEFMKAALGDEMMFKPLAFVYPEDELASETEDQLMLGEEVMIAPVVTQNAAGRSVYLPEAMTFVKFLPDGSISQVEMEKGLHYVKIALNEVAFFIKKGKCIPVVDKAECVADLDLSTIQLIGSKAASYRLYDDDGIHKNYEDPSNWKTLKN